MSDVVEVPLRIYSINFAYPNNTEALPILDPVTNTPIGSQPEWIPGYPTKPAAYVQGTQPTIQVVFTQNEGGPAGSYTIGAEGNVQGIGVEAQTVEITFDSSAMSQPVLFKLSAPLPSEIGQIEFSWQWYLSTANGNVSIGSSSHTLYTTWKPLADIDSPTTEWLYLPLVEWTCQWAARLNNEKDICDAIIKDVYLSGLTYGVMEWDVRSMLLNGGGMCGGWYRMFQSMAACQGVLVERRAYLVDWRTLDRNQAQWCAIVVDSGGLNKSEPIEDPSTFHDNNSAFPINEDVPIADSVEKRYRFWGMQGKYFDGHCINFLEYNGQLYLYDSCFFNRSIEVDMPMPPQDFSILGGEQLASFKANYLNYAVNFMLGSLYNGEKFYQTTPMPYNSMVDDAAINGMTVKTEIIPDVNAGFPEITFYWAP